MSQAGCLAILRATLHDRLPVEETAQLAAQLPMLIRGLYFEGWDPTGKPVKERHREDFLGRMQREMERYDIDPERAARRLPGAGEPCQRRRDSRRGAHASPLDTRTMAFDRGARPLLIKVQRRPSPT